ncbi:hypothetical protein E4H12_05525 [Candidatus Thorarchaeota archaeon]|nr:MAG: hypothetical protein E4H12_05525 [Candidatus Thorarchaeota archaeon]
MNPEKNGIDDEMIEKAKQLLLLTDLVDKYPLVVARRVSGLVYLIIAGGISFATLIYMSLQDIVGLGDPFLVNLAFVGISLFFSWLVAFRLVLPLTQSYPQVTSLDEGGKAPFVIWGILATCIVILSFITFSTGIGYLFVPGLQLIMGTGFLSNYVLGRRSEGMDFFTREHLYFALAVFLSFIPMIMFLELAYVILIVVDMGGIYIIGIYMLITAERLLLESKGQG